MRSRDKEGQTLDAGERDEIEARLKEQVAAYHEAAMLFTAVQLGLAEALDRSGPATPEVLASALGLKRPALKRFLRGLVAMRLCEESADERFSLTPAGALLLPDSPSNLREKAQVVVEQYWLPWRALSHSLRTGEPPFPEIFGANVSDWRAAAKDRSEPFYRYLAKEEIKAPHGGDLMRNFGTIRADTVASIGGGHGGFLVPLLAEVPELKAIVFDAPAIVEGATPLFQALGLEQRVTFVAGDILKSIPVDADIYILKGVLQQHGDAQARTILQNNREAMTPGGRLIVYERLMPENATDDPAATMLDLHMMVISGGKARTKTEVERLLAEAGFTIAEHKQTSEGLAVIEAHTAESKPQQ